MADKISVLLIFGGNSSEHEISCLSAETVKAGFDSGKYHIETIYITKKGAWHLFEGSPAKACFQDESELGPRAAILPGCKAPSFVVFSEEGTAREVPVDIVFPVLHGKNGEDGSIQGLLELAQIPYVGSTVLGSAASMDKLTTKRIVLTTGIRQAAYVPVYLYELSRLSLVLERIESRLPYPVYVKPAGAGSSVGVSLANSREDLKEALFEAAKHDARILVEEAIVGREIECAVLGNDEVRASGVGEILAADTFYTYEAKYHSEESRTVLDPSLPVSTVEEIRNDARTIFKAVGAKGLARVDFFVEEKTGEVVFNEINTMPGFTKISMYPMLFRQRGLELSNLLDELVRLGLELHGGRTNGPAAEEV